MASSPNYNNHDSSSGLPKFPSQLPESFWNESQRLRNIRDYARSRKTSPDAVLHIIFAVLSAYTDQKCNTGLGKPAAASFYTFVVGPSGAGKNRAIEAGLDYLNLNDDEVATITEGSPQGIIQSYMTKTKSGNFQSKHGALLISDEGAQLVASERGDDKHTGLRTAWCKMFAGTQDPGQTNASAETSRSLPGGSYTFGWIVGLQDSFAVKFMAQGADQGLTQRVSWASLADAHRVKGVLVHTPASPINKSLLRIRNSQAITFDKEITKILIDDDDIRGDLHDPNPGMTGGIRLNNHMYLQLSKAALLLSILHDQTHVDMKMWELAEQVVKTSYEIRDSFIKEAESEASASRRKRLQEKAYEKAVIEGKTDALSAREFTTNRLLDNALKDLIRHVEGPLKKGCRGSHSFRCAWQSISHRRRSGELAHLKNQLQIMFNETIEGRSSTQQLQSQPSEAKADVSTQMGSEAETPVSSESVPPLEAPPVVLEESPLPISLEGASDEMIETVEAMLEEFHAVRHRVLTAEECFDRLGDTRGVDRDEAIARVICQTAEVEQAKCDYGQRPDDGLVRNARKAICKGERPTDVTAWWAWNQIICQKLQADIDEAVLSQFEKEFADEVQAAEAELDRMNKLNREKPVLGPRLPWIGKVGVVDFDWWWDENSEEYAIVEEHERGRREQRVDLQEKFTRVDERRRQWEEVA